MKECKSTTEPEMLTFTERRSYKLWTEGNSLDDIAIIMDKSRYAVEYYINSARRKKQSNAQLFINGSDKANDMVVNISVTRAELKIINAALNEVLLRAELEAKKVLTERKPVDKDNSAEIEELYEYIKKLSYRCMEIIDETISVRFLENLSEDYKPLPKDRVHYYFTKA